MRIDLDAYDLRAIDVRCARALLEASWDLA